MSPFLWSIIRSGARIGIISGALVGLIAGFAGSLLTSSLSDNVALAANVFLLLAISLPLVFYVSLVNNPITDNQTQVRAAVTWLPAVLLSVVVFMMPVVMIPFVLNKGVTFENSSNWYAQVFDGLGLVRVLLVAVISALGFALVVSRAQKQNYS